MSQTITAGQAFNPYYKSCGFWYMDAIAGVTLTDGARFTIRLLLRYAGEDGEAYPAVDTLAEEIGRSVRQVQRYLRELENVGLIRRFKRLWCGKQSSNWFRFLWVESLFNVMSPKATPKTQEKTEYRGNADELLPQPADRGSAPAESGTLSPLRDAIQHLHNTLPGGTNRSDGKASHRTASWFRHRASQALGRKASADEVLEHLTGEGFRGFLDSLRKRRKVPMSISGICEYLYNWLAPKERQTLNYRPENGLPIATMTELPSVSAESGEAF